MARPRTLRGRLALYYAAALAVLLVAYSLAAYLVVLTSEDETGEKSEAEEAEVLRGRLLVTLGIGLPAALAVAVPGGLWIARRGLSPLEEVVRAAGEYGVDRLERRIPPPPPQAGEEVERLVAALNGMLGRIERSVGGLRRFTADASHELRTPLSILMGELEVTLRRPRDEAALTETIARALEELQRLSRLVEALLTLARADGGELPLSPVRLDAAALAADVLEPYFALAATRGLALQLEAPGAAPIVADPLWLGRALSNLVDNACKFTPAGGAITVSVASAGGRVHITVRDSGPGLRTEEHMRVFERFFRGATVRGSVEGFGLGLPLARDIVRAQGGTLSVRSAPDEGAEFRIDLPAAPA